MFALLNPDSRHLLIGPVAMAASYLLGSLCTGYYLVRAWTGKDIGNFGSGSIGAKNVGRMIGRWGFIATLAGDAAKGALAVWMARHFAAGETVELLAWGGVTIGHIWPFQLGFRGGKGMGVSLGALAVYDAWSLCIYAAMAAAAWLSLRSALLGGLLAVALMPIVAVLRGANAVTASGFAAIALLLLFAHRKNIVAQLAARGALRLDSGK